MSKIQIDEELFVRLCRLHLLGDESQKAAVRKGLQEKYDAIQRRNNYTAYKTSDNPQEREKARLRYLDDIGLSDDFRY